MFSMTDFALNMLANNPKIANNPQAQNYISVIRSGDSAKGAEIAKNICSSYGVTPEEGVAKAKNFFNI